MTSILHFPQSLILSSQPRPLWVTLEKGEEKGHSAITKVVIRKYTINIHNSRQSSLDFWNRIPWALTEIWILLWRRKLPMCTKSLSPRSKERPIPCGVVWRMQWVISKLYMCNICLLPLQKIYSQCRWELTANCHIKLSNCTEVLKIMSQYYLLLDIRYLFPPLSTISVKNCDSFEVLVFL